MRAETAPLVEQPADWTEPGAHPVCPGVHRIPLPLPHDGLRAVNLYVIDDPRGPVLVDPGWAMPSTAQALARALRRLGSGPADVSRIVVTHAHHDHYTHALELQAGFGTRVSIGRGERHTVRVRQSAAGQVLPPQVPMLRRCGAAELADAYAAVYLTFVDPAPLGEPDSWLDDGDTLDLRGRTLDVLATPGHTRGHIVLRDAAAGLLFAGDHVLPHITPSIGFELAPEPLPLRSYLDSLRLVGDLPDTLLLPAHGAVGRSVHRRVGELLAHHEARLDAVARHVADGAGTACEVARLMPWTRRRRKLDELDTVNQVLAVLEIEAHLDVLVHLGALTVATRDEVRVYTP